MILKFVGFAKINYICNQCKRLHKTNKAFNKTINICKSCLKTSFVFQKLLCWQW